MNRGTTLGSVLTALSILSLSPTTQATLINFDELVNQKMLFADAPPLVDKYFYSDGVWFTSHYNEGLWEILQQGALGLDARSGENFLAFSKSAINSQSITMLFSDTIDQFSAYVGSVFSAQWTIEAYFNSQLVYSEAIQGVSRQYSELSFNGMLVDKVNIISTATYGVLDDLFFRTATAAAVPLSSTLTLMLAGLLVPISRRRRLIRA